MKRYLINYLKRNKSVRDVLSLTGVQAALRPIQLFKSFFVAKYLGPEVYGILKSVEMISMLDKFGTLGFKDAIIRNATTARAKGDVLALENIKDNSYSGELILSLILFFTGITISFWFQERVFVVAIILASIGLFTSKLLGIYKTELHINKRFGPLGKVILFQGIINSVLVIATVPFYNVYAVLVVPSISSLVVVFLAARMTGSFFRLRIDRSGFMSVLKVSIPLTLATLSFGLFRYTERFLIISYLGLTAVGIFGFADTVIGIFISLLLGSVLKVRGIKIFEELGNHNFKTVHKTIIRETGLLILISFGFIILIGLGMKIFIPILLPKWESAIKITMLFSLVLPLKLLSSYVNVVFKSPIVNKLRFYPIIQLISTIFLIVGLQLLKHYECLSLTTFILVDVFAYAFLHFSSVFYYYKIYYLKFIVNDEN